MEGEDVLKKIEVPVVTEWETEARKLKIQNQELIDKIKYHELQLREIQDDLAKKQPKKVKEEIFMKLVRDEKLGILKKQIEEKDEQIKRLNSEILDEVEKRRLAQENLEQLTSMEEQDEIMLNSKKEARKAILELQKLRGSVMKYTQIKKKLENSVRDLGDEKETLIEVFNVKVDELKDLNKELVDVRNELIKKKIKLGIFLKKREGGFKLWGKKKLKH